MAKLKIRVCSSCNKAEKEKGNWVKLDEIMDILKNTVQRGITTIKLKYVICAECASANDDNYFNRPFHEIAKDDPNIRKEISRYSRYNKFGG